MIINYFIRHNRMNEHDNSNRDILKSKNMFPMLPISSILSMSLYDVQYFIACCCMLIYNLV